MKKNTLLTIIAFLLVFFTLRSLIAEETVDCKECCKGRFVSTECCRQCGDCDMYSDEATSECRDYPS